MAEEIQGQLIKILDEGLSADQFDCVGAHAILSRAAQMSHEVEDDDIDVSAMCGDRFQKCLEALSLEPSVRCVAPKIFINLMDYLGECEEESLQKLGNVLRDLGRVFQDVLKAWTDLMASADMEEQEEPLHMLNDIWTAYLEHTTSRIKRASIAAARTDGTFQQFIDSLLFSAQLVVTVLGIDNTAFVRVYCDWLALVLANRLVFPHSEASAFSLGTLLVPPIVKLFFSPISAEPTQDVPTPCRRAVTSSAELTHLKDLFHNPLALGGILCDDLGHEAYRVILECAIRHGDTSTWTRVFESAFHTSDKVSSMLTTEVVYGLPASAWKWPISAGGEFTFSPALVIAQLTLKHLAPLAALYTKALLTQNKNLAAKQAFALMVVKALIASMPHRLLSPPEFVLPEINFVAVEQSEPTSNVPSESSDTEGPPEPKMSKGQEKQIALETLQVNLTQPLLAFITQTLFLAPERRDARDKLLQFLSEVVKYLKTFELQSSTAPFLYRLIVTLVKLSDHEKALMRTVSLELLASLQIDNPDVCSNVPTLVQAVLIPMLMRTSDIQHTVRARAMDLTAICLNDMAKKSHDNVALRQWLTASLIRDERRLTGELTTLDWNAVLVLLDLRLQDDKLIVRKAGVAVMEAIINIISMLRNTQDNTTLSVMDIISEETVMMVCDDSALTVRQRSVSLAASLVKSSDLQSRLCGSKCLMKLALDNEESISSKARQTFFDEVISPLPLELRRLLRARRQDPSSNVACNNVALMSALLDDKEVAESMFRIVTIHTRENSACDITNIVTAITDEHQTEDTCMFSPIGVLRILNLCLEVGICLNKSWSKVSPELASSLFEAMCKHRVLSCVNDEQLEYVSVSLTSLRFLAEYTMTSKNQLLLQNHIRDCFGSLSVHPTLARPALAIYFTLLPDQKALRTELTRLILFVRETISDLSTENRCKISAMQAATAFQVGGFVYSMATRLPPNNKVAVHLSEIAGALATFMLGIARNAFHGNRPASENAFQEGSVRKTSVDDIQHWINDVPPFLRGIALTSAAQILLSQEPIAKRLMSQLIFSGFSPCNTDGPNPLLANMAFAVADFSLKMTSLVDPYFILISSILATSRDGFLRSQVLALLSQQAAQDYLKPRGLLLYHLLYALGDPLHHVRDLAQRVFTAILAPKTRDIIHGYFLEMICFLCGFLNHPQVPLAIDLHPMAMDVPDALTMCVDRFNLKDDPGRRNAIYRSLLASASDVTKHALIKKILQQFLKPFIPGDTGSDTRQAVPLPLSRDTPVGLALGDVLLLLASSDMQLTFSTGASLFVQDSTGQDSGVAEEEIKEAKELRARRCRDLLKEFVGKSIVPVLAALRRALQEKNSALQKEVFECLATILYAWRDDLDEMVSEDPRLVQLLRRSYAEQTTEVQQTEPTSFNELFLKQDLRSRFTCKPLAQSMSMMNTSRPRHSLSSVCSARSALNTSVILVRSATTTARAD